MSAIFEHTFTVDEKPENYIRHVNNLRYLEWFVDTAVMHASALGWGMQVCKERGLAWVVKTHAIDYLAESLQGDTLTIYTWIHKITKSRSIRRYKCIRKADMKIIAKAETLWVLVDYDTGRPKSIPKDFLNGFVPVKEEDTP